MYTLPQYKHVWYLRTHVSNYWSFEFECGHVCTYSVWYHCMLPSTNNREESTKLHVYLLKMILLFTSDEFKGHTLGIFKSLNASVCFWEDDRILFKYWPLKKVIDGDIVKPSILISMYDKATCKLLKPP